MRIFSALPWWLADSECRLLVAVNAYSGVSLSLVAIFLFAMGTWIIYVAAELQKQKGIESLPCKKNQSSG